MWSKCLTVTVVSLSLVATGCSSSPAGIPEALEPQIDTNLTFKEVLTSPESYTGHLILLGGGNPQGEAVETGDADRIVATPAYHGSKADDGPHTVARASVGSLSGARSGNLDARDAGDIRRRGQWEHH